MLPVPLHSALFSNWLTGKAAYPSTEGGRMTGKAAYPSTGGGRMTGKVAYPSTGGGRIAEKEWHRATTEVSWNVMRNMRDAIRGFGDLQGFSGFSGILLVSRILRILQKNSHRYEKDRFLISVDDTYILVRNSSAPEACRPAGSAPGDDSAVAAECRAFHIRSGKELR